MYFCNEKWQKPPSDTIITQKQKKQNKTNYTDNLLFPKRRSGSKTK